MGSRGLVSFALTAKVRRLVKRDRPKPSIDAVFALNLEREVKAASARLADQPGDYVGSGIESPRRIGLRAMLRTDRLSKRLRPARRVLASGSHVA